VLCQSRDCKKSLMEKLPNHEIRTVENVMRRPSKYEVSYIDESCQLDLSELAFI